MARRKHAAATTTTAVPLDSGSFHHILVQIAQENTGSLIAFRGASKFWKKFADERLFEHVAVVTVPGSHKGEIEFREPQAPWARLPIISVSKKNIRRANLAMSALTAYIRILDDRTQYGTKLRLQPLDMVRYRHEYHLLPAQSRDRPRGELPKPHAYRFVARTHVFSLFSWVPMPTIMDGAERLVIHINALDGNQQILGPFRCPPSVRSIVAILHAKPEPGKSTDGHSFCRYFLGCLDNNIDVTLVGFEHVRHRDCHDSGPAGNATLKAFIEEKWAPSFPDDKRPRVTSCSLEEWDAAKRTTESAQLESLSRLPNIPGLHWH